MGGGPEIASAAAATEMPDTEIRVSSDVIGNLQGHQQFVVRILPLKCSVRCRYRLFT